VNALPTIIRCGTFTLGYQTAFQRQSDVLRRRGGRGAARLAYCEAESTEAVISLMSQGRKPGLRRRDRTWRLSTLHKDAAAEANNLIIRRTWLDAI
jgi:hypothetical protein